LNLKAKFRIVLDHASITTDIIKGKSRQQIREKILQLQKEKWSRMNQAEIYSFISRVEQKQSSQVDTFAKLPLNKVCCIEDWKNKEFQEVIQQLQSESYYNKCEGILTRKPGLIHRKDWEWTLGIIAMNRFGKLNSQSTAIGVGAGKELVLFYLANKLAHVFATDLYNKDEWKEFAPRDFPEHPQKYAPYAYREDALTVMRMDGKRLEFPSDSFDIAFSFSSIEHFGGENHSGALQSAKEMARVLKQGGIAIIATDYILNGKNPPDLTNQFFSEKTIYSDLIDRLEEMRLVEPLDLRISSRTLSTILDVADAFNWDTNKVDDTYKLQQPCLVLKLQNILVTSIMLVFQKS